MIALAGGSVLTLLLHDKTGLTWSLVISFWVIAIPLQFAYSHRLYKFLEGEDPVATFRVRNLRQLKTIIPIPVSISVLNFLARMMWWAGLVALFFSLGFLVIDSVRLLD